MPPFCTKRSRRSFFLNIYILHTSLNCTKLARLLSPAWSSPLYLPLNGTNKQKKTASPTQRSAVLFNRLVVRGVCSRFLRHCTVNAVYAETVAAETWRLSQRLLPSPHLLRALPWGRVSVHQQCTNTEENPCPGGIELAEAFFTIFHHSWINVKRVFFLFLVSCCICINKQAASVVACRRL